ncbi:MAG: DUF420 domain-containing protein [Pirellulaceae bacterium]
MQLTDVLPHVNAALNALATVLLLVGYGLIRAKRIEAHRNVMISCFGVSCVFLISYLTNYAVQGGNTEFPKEEYPFAAKIYYPFLAAHVILAALVPFLALRTIYLGLKRRDAAHRVIARWTFPIWLYVSISGVIVYAMIRWMYLPTEV